MAAQVDGEILTYLPHRLLTLVCSSEKLFTGKNDGAKTLPGKYDQAVGGTVPPARHPRESGRLQGRGQGWAGTSTVAPRALAA